MADIARSVFVSRASGAAPYSVDVLVALGRMLPEIDTCAEHSSDVSVSFIKAFLYYGVNERGAVKEHPFVALIVVFFRDFLSSMNVSFP